MPAAPGFAESWRWPLRLVIIAVFATVNLFVYLSIHVVGKEATGWQRELAAVDAMAARGDMKGAAAGIVAFGKRNPGALGTAGYNDKAGRYHEAIGDWKAAAEHYTIASSLKPKEKGWRARAGEAWLQAGETEKAMQMFLEEIAKGDPLDDLANLRLGQLYLERSQWAAAFECLALVRDREKWKQELDTAYARLDREVLSPARADAGLPDTLATTEPARTQ
jgi:tetratricopeptide (TPR) repeat protein